MISVVIPAHEEEHTLGRCLQGLLEDARPGELEIIVVCNGCTDATAAVAARFPYVTVLETPIASKIHALNLGDAAASHFPRFYIDADVEIATSDLRKIASILLTGAALYAAPRAHFDLTGRPSRVRSYYRLWQRLPAVENSHVGAGVYALTAEGRRRFGPFPDVIADDLFIRQLFRAHERVRVMQTEAIVQTPYTLSALVRRKARVFRGNQQLAQRFPNLAPSSGWSGCLAAVRRHPALLLDLPAFLYVSLAAKLSARSSTRKTGGTWGQDPTTRNGANGSKSVAAANGRAKTGERELSVASSGSPGGAYPPPPVREQE